MISLILLFAVGIGCPVLNTATAKGTFGNLQASVTHADKSSAYTCLFTRPEYKLTVEVTPLSELKSFAHFSQRVCRDSHDEMPLKGIGNEALACSAGRTARIEDKIAARVRDQAFVVTLRTTDKMADAHDIQNKITLLAEEVAGNLF